MTPIDPLSAAEINRAVAEAHVARSRYVGELLARFGAWLRRHGSTRTEPAGIAAGRP